MAANIYSALATAVLFLHALFIAWVVFGVLFARSRPVLRWLHIISLVWGILTELLPLALSFDAPRELAGAKGGRRSISGSFLLHYMDKLVYPDVSATALTVAGVIVCTFNLALYGTRAWRIRNDRWTD